MRSKRFLAVAVAALLLMGLAGVGSITAFAQTPTPAHLARTVVAQPVQPAVTATDGDNVDQQVGDQSTLDTGTVVTDTVEAGTAETGAEEITSSLDTDNIQEGQGPQVEDGQPDLPGAAQEAPEDASQ